MLYIVRCWGHKFSICGHTIFDTQKNNLSGLFSFYVCWTSFLTQNTTSVSHKQLFNPIAFFISIKKNSIREKSHYFLMAEYYFGSIDTVALTRRFHVSEKVLLLLKGTGTTRIFAQTGIIVRFQNAKNKHR